MPPADIELKLVFGAAGASPSRLNTLQVERETTWKFGMRCRPRTDILLAPTVQIQSMRVDR